ncbi:hypothetical protein ACFW9U_21130 [Rhodococcus aetherivorans]|uniref:hypothetical protein n=1 Tax=Rhodococcus aetherivorans TaxID=191292 RepID=UPI00366BF63C
MRETVGKFDAFWWLLLIAGAPQYGVTTVSKRLPLSLLAVLDEVANVRRLWELPNRYLHSGSRGTVITTTLLS